VIVEIDKIKKLIAEINKIFALFSTDYFEAYKVEKVNPSKTTNHVPVTHILNYRLNLHESINDYLMPADLNDIKYFYRVKPGESILDKIERFSHNEDKFPVNNWLNDIFGARIIVETETFNQLMDLFDDWQEEFGLKNWYLREKQEYRGLHVYFKNRSNFYFPWELQVWDEKDMANNITSHRKYKRNFVR
jgi:hypothetical protein